MTRRWWQSVPGCRYIRGGGSSPGDGSNPITMPKPEPPPPSSPSGGDNEVVVAAATEKHRLDKLGSAFDEAKAAEQEVNEYVGHVEWILERLVTGGIELAAAIVQFFVVCALKFYVLFPFLWIGVFALAARRLFLWMIPTLLSLTGPIVFVINGILVWLTVVLDSVVLVVRAIESVVNAIAKLFPGHHAVFNNIPDYPKLMKITDAEFRATLKAIPPTCVKFVGPSPIVTFFTKYGLHRIVCPVVRYTYPLEPLYNLLRLFFSPWAYYGDADPYPNEPHQNCDAADEVTNTDFVCAGLGAGYLILGVALPVLLFAIFLFVAVRPLFKLTVAVLYSIWIALEAAHDALIVSIDMIAY